MKTELLIYCYLQYVYTYTCTVVLLKNISLTVQYV